MKIAVCEDEKEIAAQLSGIVSDCLNELKADADIDIFFSGKEFETSGNVYDLLFLDCRLSDCNGIDLAKRLRNSGRKTAIIFVTAYEEYVYESFEVNAFRYLLKPIEKETLRKAVKAFYTVYKEDSYLTIPTGKKIIQISLDRVMYIEAGEKHSLVRTLDGTYDSIKSITDYQEEIDSFRFFRTHRSFLVNMKYITEVENNVITLTNGEKVEISRRNLTNFNKCYMNFLKYSV